MIEIRWNPSRKDLREFGIVILAAFTAIGLVKGFWPWSFWIQPNHILGYICMGIAWSVGLSAILGWRIIALPFYLLWMSISFILSNVMLRLTFGIFFYLIITPLGLFMRFLGRDRLQLRRSSCATYWRNVEYSHDTQHYTRRF